MRPPWARPWTFAREREGMVSGQQKDGSRGGGCWREGGRGGVLAAPNRALAASRGASGLQATAAVVHLREID
jgi:hypothetical protein